MPQYNEFNDITSATIETIIIATNIHYNNYQIVIEAVNCSKLIVTNVKKRVHKKIDKKNIFSLKIVNIKLSRND